jgi:hypothetical protein
MMTIRKSPERPANASEVELIASRANQPRCWQRPQPTADHSRLSFLAVVRFVFLLWKMGCGQLCQLWSDRMDQAADGAFVVSHAPDSDSQRFGSGRACRGAWIRWKPRSPGRARPHGRASYGSSPASIFPWHSQPARIMADMTNNREKTSGLPPTASSDTDCWSRPEGIYARDAKAP